MTLVELVLRAINLGLIQLKDRGPNAGPNEVLGSYVFMIGAHESRHVYARFAESAMQYLRELHGDHVAFQVTEHKLPDRRQLRYVIEATEPRY
jgi:hypothetical protein